MRQAQKIALVQCYIHHMKGIEVNINPPRTIHDSILLEQAFATATQYFNR